MTSNSGENQVSLATVFTLPEERTNSALDLPGVLNGGQQTTSETPSEFHSMSGQQALHKDRDTDVTEAQNVSDWQHLAQHESATGDGGNEENGDAYEAAEQQELLALWSLLQHRLGLNFSDMNDEPHPQVLEELTMDGIVSYINAGKCKNIIVMTGAGISTSAGIPDFRSPGSGLYANLEKYNLPSPESIFDIQYFKENPDPFFMLAKELYPGNYKPTISHYFISLLAKKGLLLRTYTQNIDGLERGAGLDDSYIVAAHGTFHTCHCLDCREEYSEAWVKGEIFKDVIPKCTKCQGLVKPDIIFFGESLPVKFFQMMPTDFKECDLLIVMGTSLVVQPFASLIDRVPKDTPRLLINKEKCGVGLFAMFGGFNFDEENKYRDVAWLGSCDDGCFELAEKLGWKEELVAHAGKDGVVYNRTCSKPTEQAQLNVSGLQESEKECPTKHDAAMDASHSHMTHDVHEAPSNEKENKPCFASL